MADQVRTSDAPGVYDLDWSDPASMEDYDLCSFIKAQVLAGKARRQQWEAEALECLAWAEGDQHVYFDHENNDLRELTAALEGHPQDEWRKFETMFPVKVNKIASLIMHRIALLIGGPTRLEAEPDTQEDDDQAAAALQSDLLTFLWRNGPDPVRHALVNQLWHMFCAGVVFAHPVWNPDYGAPEPFPPDLEHGDDPAERAKKIEAYKGRIAQRTGRDVSELNFKPDGSIDLPPGAVHPQWRTGFDLTEPEYCHTVEEAPWLIETDWRSMEWLATYYPDSVKHISPDTGSDDYLQHWRMQHRRYASRGEDSGQVKAEVVPIHSLWRPAQAWGAPGGALVRICGDTVLHKGFHPYAHGRLPFVALTDRPSASFRPRSFVFDIMELQGTRNRTWSQAVAAMHYGIAPKVMIEEKGGAKVADSSFDAEARVIRVPAELLDNPNYLKWLDRPTIPFDFWRLEELIDKRMDDISGVHQSTRGISESASQSGRSIALLAQGDARGSFVPRELVAGALGQLGEQSLWLWWQFVPTERTLTITGEGNERRVLVFAGKDLLGAKSKAPGPSTFNVTVQLAPDNEYEETLAFVRSMVEIGVWNPQDADTAQRIERMLEEKISPRHSRTRMHRENARAENRRLMEGAKDVRVSVGDLDATHIEEHDWFTTTAGYRRAAAKDQGLEQRMSVHRNEHLFALAEKKIAVEEAMALAKANAQRKLDYYAQATAPPAAPDQGAAVRVDTQGMAIPVGAPGGNGNGRGSASGRI